MRILCTGDIKRVFRIQVQSANTLHGEHNIEYSASDQRRYIRSESMNWVAPIKDEQVLQKFKDTLKEIDEKYLILFEIGIGTGLQLQDILQFKVGDVRGKESLTVNIGARSIEQTFHLSSELQKIIADFIKDRDDDEYLCIPQSRTFHRAQIHRYTDHAQDLRMEILQRDRGYLLYPESPQSRLTEYYIPLYRREAKPPGNVW